MIEIRVRVLVDTQDPSVAYNEIQNALRFSGLITEMPDTWLVNNTPMPAQHAQQVAWNWQKRNAWRDSVRFVSNDPAFQTRLDNLRSVKCDA